MKQQRSHDDNRFDSDSSHASGNTPVTNSYGNRVNSNQRLCHVCASPQHLAAQCPMRQSVSPGQAQGQSQRPNGQRNNNGNNRFNRSARVNAMQNVNSANVVNSNPETTVKQVAVTSQLDLTSVNNQE